MTQELIHTRNGNTLYNASPGLKDGEYKILIPKGTHRWRVSVEPFKVAEPALAWAAFDAPPVQPGTPTDGETRNTLARLWSGETLSFYSPPNSGALTISTPESTTTFRADRDRWLYLRLDFPGIATINWQSHIELHADAALAPPVIDKDLYARAHKLVERVGLVQSMYRLSGCTSNAEFDRKVTDSGVWPGLIEMVRLAEGRGD